MRSSRATETRRGHSNIKTLSLFFSYPTSKVFLPLYGWGHPMKADTKKKILAWGMVIIMVVVVVTAAAAYLAEQ